MIDEREIQLPRADETILAGVRDGTQREMLRQTMQSSLYKTAELARRVSDVEAENRKLARDASEGRRSVEEASRLRSKLASAEHAMNESARAAEKERFARIAAEDARDTLLAALHSANGQPSRLERLLVEHGRRD